MDKMIKWINIFKKAGDVAVDLDTGHLPLPWVAITFLLQVTAQPLAPKLMSG